MEFSVSVVRSGLDKFCKNVIFIGSANEPVDRNAHFLRNKRGEDVSEITGRNGNVYLLAKRDFTAREEVAVSGNVVNNLRNESAPVNGVCDGEENAC